MKSTTTLSEPSFQPVSINITLESPEELNLFCQVVLANVRIPDMLYRDGSINNDNERQALADMLGQIYRGDLQKHFSKVCL